MNNAPIVFRGHSTAPPTLDWMTPTRELNSKTLKLSFFDTED